MASLEEQRREESEAMERFHVAWQRRRTAFLALNKPCPSDENLDEFANAKSEADKAYAEMNRIAEEIRAGKRR